MVRGFVVCLSWLMAFRGDFFPVPNPTVSTRDPPELGFRRAGTTLEPEDKEREWAQGCKRPWHPFTDVG